jgi:SAM-dependent methyltransferase
VEGEQELSGRHAREAAFHDRLAADAALRPPSDPDWWEASLLEAARPLEGKRVLELGCGDGDLTLHLVAAGAQVSALDVSVGMVELARSRVARFRPEAEVELVVAPAEATPFEDEAFDLVVGKWVLHHLDLDRGVAEVHRVMRTGGRGVFIETSAFNPVLAFARRHVVSKGRFGTWQVGTPDEHPLTRRDIRSMRARFRRCEVDHPDFLLLSIFDRNVLRYRYKELTPRLLRWDQAIGRRAPFLGPLSWYLRLVVEK